MSATVSLLGLSRINPGILDELALPDGLDADLVKDNLLAETAELEVIYPDALFMQSMIGRARTVREALTRKQQATAPRTAPAAQTPAEQPRQATPGRSMLVPIMRRTSRLRRRTRTRRTETAIQSRASRGTLK